MTDTPSEWALIEAYDRVEPQNAYWSEEDKVKIANNDRPLRELAREIEKNNPPPEDPDLEAAREVCAQVAEEIGFPSDASSYRSGKFDQGVSVNSVIAMRKQCRREWCND